MKSMKLMRTKSIPCTSVTFEVGLMRKGWRLMGRGKLTLEHASRKNGFKRSEVIFVEAAENDLRRREIHGRPTCFV